jgi:hypothetical protein
MGMHNLHLVIRDFGDKALVPAHSKMYSLAGSVTVLNRRARHLHVGNGTLHGFMRAALVSQIGLWFVIPRSKIEDRPNLLAFHVERPCATQPRAIGSDIRARG